MSRQVRKGLVPALRFPEFWDDGEWEERTLGNESTIVMGSSPKSEFYNEAKNGLPLLQGNADIKNRVSLPRIYTSQITKECLEGDILLSVRAPVGSVAKSMHHACIGRGIAAIRANKDNSQEFLYQWLLFFESQWHNISQGGTFDAVNGEDVRQLMAGIPSFPEQQKIADCLASIDSLITTETQKHDELKAHKKGLMQQLFPAEGEIQPKLRFPEFRDSGDWEEKRLEELLEFKNGINAPREQYGKGTKFINVLDILQNEFITYEKIIGSVDVSDAIVDKFSVSYGDILFQRSSETQEEVGTANVYLDKSKTATFGGFVIRGKKIGEYEPIFLNKLLKCQSIRNSISLKSGGSTRFNIGQETLSLIKVLLPSIPEQQKIADCLDSLDALITAQTEKIAALKTMPV